MRITDETTALLKRMNNDLQCDGYALRLEETGRVVLENGNDDSADVSAIPDAVFELLAGAGVTQLQLVTFAEWLTEGMNAQWKAGHASGRKAGRQAMVETVHELLGVDKLVSSLEQLGDISRSVDNCAPR